jgi:hypothetical protein
MVWFCDRWEVTQGLVIKQVVVLQVVILFENMMIDN